MKHMKTVITMIAVAGLTAAAQAQFMYYGFATDVEGFQNSDWKSTDPVGWGALGTIKMNHTAGGWQLPLLKEFSWGPGGGSANQQTDMQALQYYGSDAHIAFDIIADGTSFPAATGVWYSFNLAANSDGTVGWTQIEHVIDGWQNPDQSDMRVWHRDYTFDQLGWADGDSTWFQLYLGSNSDAANPVNFYIDNFVVYQGTVPEPTSLALAGLGAALLALRRRR